MGAIREITADLSERESGPIFDVFFFGRHRAKVGRVREAESFGRSSINSACFVLDCHKSSVAQNLNLPDTTMAFKVSFRGFTQLPIELIHFS